MGSPARLAVLLLLDLTALGRQEEWEEPKRRRDSARSARPDFASSPPPRDDGDVIFVALLRAINLGRVNRVPMGDLRFALTDAGFAKIAAKNPFAPRHADSGPLHVAFLKARPAAAARRAFSGRTFGDDEFVIRDTEVYLRYPHGVAASKMNTALFEGGLGTPATVRTWKVVTRLNELAAGASR